MRTELDVDIFTTINSLYWWIFSPECSGIIISYYQWYVIENAMLCSRKCSVMSQKIAAIKRS